VDTILITGGAGFIGSHLCEHLVAAGDNVVCFDNFNPGYSPEVKLSNLDGLRNQENFTLIEGDILDRAALNRAFLQFQFTKVVHLAAKAGVRPSILDPASYADVNVRGTINVLEECIGHRTVGKIFFASSSSVYGNNKKLPFSETDSAVNPISPYAATKRAGELLCYTYHSLHGIPIVCCRFFTVYGPRQRPDMGIYKFVQAISEDREIVLYGDGRTSRDYTYIDDIIHGITGILDSSYQYDIVNLGESAGVSLRQLVAYLEEALGKKARTRYIPQSPGDVDVTFADIRNAKLRYQYNPQWPIKAGIEEFVKWFMETRANRYAVCAE